MLASDLLPVTPEVFNAVVDSRRALVVDGVIYRPRTREVNGRERVQWEGANGRTFSLNRLDSLMDAEVPMFYIAEAD